MWHGIHNLSRMRRVCLPINRGNQHWVLGVVDFPAKKFGIIDPFKSNNQELDDKLREWLLAVCNGQKVPIEISKWTKLTQSAINFELQDNSWDCGVYTICLAKMFCEGSTETLTCLHVNKMRHLLLLDIALDYFSFFRGEETKYSMHLPIAIKQKFGGKNRINDP